MANKKDKTQTIPAPTAPLLSWDIFMDSYHKTLALADDFRHLNQLSKKYAWKKEWDIEEKLFRQQQVILVTDLTLHIVYASSNIIVMNGYAPNEVIGHTPAMFQGEETDAFTKAVIREAVNRLQPFQTNIINYRKDGSVYDCSIEAFPVFNSNKKPVHFIAFEKEKSQ